MREIKFRAYIKEIKSMQGVLEVYCDGGALCDDYEYPLSSDDIHLMQFTGLKDKNGVDVYSGDVIKGKFYLGGMLKRFIGAVDVNLPYITVKGVNQYSWKICQSISDVKLFEVIGNIYENPELITK
jgi:uncharacterized phage protein (TIGR01671 family)